MKPVEPALAVHLAMVMRDMSLAAELGVVQGKRMNASGLLFNGHLAPIRFPRDGPWIPGAAVTRVLFFFCLAP